MTRTLFLLALCLTVAPSAAHANVDHTLRSASWLWDADAPEPDAAAARTPRRLRKTFDLNAPPVEATALVSVDDNHRLFVNGKLVGNKDGWREPGRYDLRPFLARGRNVIAVEGIDTGGQAGAIAAVSIVTQERGDRQSVSIVTDKTWRIDATDADKSDAWTRADFDDAKWKEPMILGPAGMGPWNLLGVGNTPAATASATKSPASQVKDVDLSPEEQQKTFAVPPGFAVELVAAEPLVNNPVCMALDDAGRVYVAESHTYRYGKDKSPVPQPSNPIVMLKPAADGKSFERVVVAEGFDDPVMGLLVKKDQMWATANNALYRFQIGPDGKATDRVTLLVDHGKAWNPFGFFVLKFGPDGLLYLSVGNHEIKIVGPNGQKVTSRGSSGIVCRMNPDGTNIEVLAQGFRVPYAFDVDPFGQLWLMSNGEGMPNRFAKVIDAPAVDYHGYSRTNDPDWLAGRNPLAPPAFELPRGANTSLLVYGGAAFPASMRGQLLAVNWGPHGLGVANHTIDLYQPDERRNLYKAADHWLTCADPRFRPTTLLHAPDGNLLLADFYNRDDESDKTGRVWRITHAEAAANAAGHTLSPAQWTDESILLDALGHPDHLRRERAVERHLQIGPDVAARLGKHAATAKEPVGAAMALWTLARLGTPSGFAEIERGAEHADWKVRRLAAQLARRYSGTVAAQIAVKLAGDPDPAVRVAAAVAHQTTDETGDALLAALVGPSAAEPFARYEACWHLARTADAGAISTLLSSDDANARLAGLIVIDIASYEKTAILPAARAALAAAIADPGKLDVERLLDLAAMNPSPELAGPLAALVRRKDLPVTSVAKGVVLLLTLPAQPGQNLDDVAKAALAGLRDGKIPVRSNADRVAILRLLPYDGPTPFAIRQIVEAARKTGEVGRTASEVARTLSSPPSPELLSALWKLLADPATGAEQRAELLATVSLLEPTPDPAQWTKLLASRASKDPKDVKDQMFAREVVRSWRRFAGNPEMTRHLVTALPALVERDPTLKPDLTAVLASLSVPPADVAAVNLPAAPDEAALRAHASTTTAGGPFLGRMVFARAGCIQCHSPGTDTHLGPPLAGVGTQTRQYLIESLFEPSKVIKTGFETEIIRTADGNAYSGLVKEVGDALRVTTAGGEDVLPKASVASRKVQKVSIMPEGLAKPLSPGELNDLLAYLQSLKAAPAAAAK